MLAILKDAETRPDLFAWSGAITRSQIEVWLGSSNLKVPDDLLDFWTKTGGGVESETMFRPTQIPSLEPYFVSGDDIDTANQYRIPKGMSVSYLVFHDGIFLSAVRLADKKLVTLDDKHEETAVFSNLEDGYLGTLRKDYASHYGLIP
jgi:hypothetical protein